AGRRTNKLINDEIILQGPASRIIMNRLKKLCAYAVLIALLISTHAVSASESRASGVQTAGSRAAPTATDWSVALVESTMKRYPTAESLKGWGYAKRSEERRVGKGGRWGR